MSKKHQPERRDLERRSFEACRTIDVTDRRAMRFWSERLGVPPEDIVEVVKEVGANSTAVALKLQAPHDDRIVPPSLPAR